LFEEQANGMLNRTVLCIRIMFSFITRKYCGTTQDEQMCVQRIMVFKLCIMVLVFKYNYMHTTNVDEPSVCNICTVSTNSVQKKLQYPALLGPKGCQTF